MTTWLPVACFAGGILVLIQFREFRSCWKASGWAFLGRMVAARVLLPVLLILALGIALSWLWLPIMISGVIVGVPYFLLRTIGRKMGWTRVSHPGMTIGFLAMFLVVVAATVRIGFVVAGSGGDGVGMDSPDGRYRAEYLEGTETFFFGGSREFLRFVVVEQSTGKAIVRREIPRTDPIQQGGVRENGRIRWDPDSKQVTFVLRDVSQWVVGVP